jgi:hypothetical protein
MDCGPAMNERIHDACKALKISHTIESKPLGKPGIHPDLDDVIAPRWDAWLRRGNPNHPRPKRWLKE